MTKHVRDSVRYRLARVADEKISQQYPGQADPIYYAELDERLCSGFSFIGLMRLRHQLAAVIL